MNTDQKINNVLAFLALLFGENILWEDYIMDFSPAYLIEKFDRYILGTQYEASWGIHPALRHRTLDQYCVKWKIPTGDNLIEE